MRLQIWFTIISDCLLCGDWWRIGRSIYAPCRHRDAKILKTIRSIFLAGPIAQVRSNGLAHLCVLWGGVRLCIPGQHVWLRSTERDCSTERKRERWALILGALFTFRWIQDWFQQWTSYHSSTITENTSHQTECIPFAHAASHTHTQTRFAANSEHKYYINNNNNHKVSANTAECRHIITVSASTSSHRLFLSHRIMRLM